MKFPFFSSFILFIIVLRLFIIKGDKADEKAEADFWERERAANEVRRKSLDDLNYISIPLDRFPMEQPIGNTTEEKETLTGCRATLTSLAEKKMVNFNGISNTDLKFSYGVANLPTLSEYDQNYTDLITCLQTFGKTLYTMDCLEEAKTVLEFSITTGSDIGDTFQTLAQIYAKAGQFEKIQELIKRAQELHSPLKASIVQKLQQFGPDTD